MRGGILIGVLRPSRTAKNGGSGSTGIKFRVTVLARSGEILDTFNITST